MHYISIQQSYYNQSKIRSLEFSSHTEKILAMMNHDLEY